MVKKIFSILIFCFILPNICFGFSAVGGALQFIAAPLIMPLIFIIMLLLIYAIVGIVALIPGAGLLFKTIAESSLELAELFFKVTTLPGALKLPFTKPNENPILAAGLSQTQPLAIAMWIFAFVVCAILIALGIGEFQAKKIIVNLIFAAVLIYFIPFICGVFIDATNVIMFHFLKELEKFSLLSRLKASIEKVTGEPSESTSLLGKIWNKIKGIFEKIWEILFPNAGEVVATVAVCLAAATAFIIFGILFIARYVFLWALVILSPIAIVCWVFPEVKEPGGRFISALRSFWIWWEEQFFHWSVIGITLSFFLYLAAKTNEALEEIYDKAVFNLGQASVSIIIVALPVLVFLYLGYTLGLRTGAMLGGAIMAGTAALATGLMTGIAGGGLKGIGRTATGWVERRVAASQWKERAGRWATTYTPPGAGTGSRIGTWAKRGIGKTLLPLTTWPEQRMQQRIKEMEKEDVVRLLSEFRSQKDMGKAEVLVAMINSGNIKDAMDPNKFRNPLQLSEIQSVLDHLKRISPQSIPKLAVNVPEVVDMGGAWGQAGLPSWDQLIPSITPQDIRKMPDTFLQNLKPSDPFLVGLASQGSIDQLTEAVKKGRKNFVDSFIQTVRDMKIQTQKKFEEINPILERELRSSPISDLFKGI